MARNSLRARTAALVTVGVAAATALGLLQSCKKRSHNETAPGETAAPKTLEPNLISGLPMPAKTLALTFDDGPGEKAVQLANFLKSKGVRATFFVTGNLATQFPGDMQAIADAGHLIANHTYTHNMPRGAALLKEIKDGDAAIAKYNKSNAWFFRPPGGAFDAQDARTTDVPELKKYVGPIFWDIGGELTDRHSADWRCWEVGETLEGCAQGYMNEIRDRGNKGIVLLHDNHNKSVDMFINHLYPKLEKEGFKFVTLAEIPDLAKRVAQFSKGVPGGSTSPQGGRPTCTEDNATHRICADKKFDVFNAGGSVVGQANPGEPVCVTGQSGSGNSTGLYFVRPPAGPGYIADKSQACTCNVAALKVCLDNQGGDVGCTKKNCK